MEKYKQFLGGFTGRKDISDSEGGFADKISSIIGGKNLIRATM